MRKCSLIWAILLLVSLTIPAYATDSVESRAFAANPSLYFEGTTAKCSVTCMGDKMSDRVSVTLTLYHEGEYVESWSTTGVYRVPLSGECDVVSGETYVLEVTWSVNGSSRPSASVTNTCP